MTPEDWQRLWQAEGAGEPRYSPADLYARAETLRGHWRYLRWFYVAGAMFVLIGGMRWFEWTRTGAAVTLTLATLHVCFGLAFIYHARVWMNVAGRLSAPPAVPVVEFYRQVLEAERARIRHALAIGVIGAAQLFVATLAMSPIFPSLTTRVAIGTIGVALLGLFGWLRYGYLGRQLAELRTLPDDPNETEA